MNDDLKTLIEDDKFLKNFVHYQVSKNFRNLLAQDATKTAIILTIILLFSPVLVQQELYAIMICSMMIAFVIFMIGFTYFQFHNTLYSAIKKGLSNDLIIINRVNMNLVYNNEGYYIYLYDNQDIKKLQRFLMDNPPPKLVFDNVFFGKGAKHIKRRYFKLLEANTGVNSRDMVFSKLVVDTRAYQLNVNNNYNYLVTIDDINKINENEYNWFNITLITTMYKIIFILAILLSIWYWVKMIF